MWRGKDVGKVSAEETGFHREIGLSLVSGRIQGVCFRKVSQVAGFCVAI